MTATASRTVTHAFRLHARTPAAFVFWMSAYAVLVILPLALGLIDLDPGRGFWTDFSVALGFVGLSMFGLQFIMAARPWIIAHPIGMDLLLSFHRKIAYIATALVFAHPIILFLLDRRYLLLLDVPTAPLRAQLGETACVAVLVLIALSVFRKRLRLGYPLWQLTHAVLSVVIVIAALGHIVLVGYYVREPWEQAVWITYSFALVGIGVWARIVKPVLRRRRRWIVADIRAEAGGATTIVLERADPRRAAERPFRFEAGQFAWVLARRSPFALTYHPFSFSSSAEHPDRVTFTVKAYQGFSREVGRLRLGESVYLDGPFGAFVVPGSEPLVLIGAGIGVTPLLSIMETLADRGSTAPIELWLGNRDEDSITCLPEIEALSGRLDLEVVHVLSHPGPDWTGERGHLDERFVRERLAGASDPDERSYLVCGPVRMMDDVERALVGSGVPKAHIHSERFGMV